MTPDRPSHGPEASAFLVAVPGAPASALAAALLDGGAALLAAQQAPRARVLAYRRAAAALRTRRSLERSWLRDAGPEGGSAVLGVSLAHAVEEIAASGRSSFLERLRGNVGPEEPLIGLAGLGLGLARRIHEELGIEDAEGLRRALDDGRLARVRGLGPARLEALRKALAPGAVAARSAGGEPTSPDELLDLDREYHARVAEGSLARIEGVRGGTPVLHTARGARWYTALFTHSARAHGLRATRDWVSVWRDDLSGWGRWTVVNARGGPSSGGRVVRGSAPDPGALLDLR